MTSEPDRLIDSYGRPHNNLRISVTDRCNIRCVYCMPEQVEFLPRAQLLTFEEIERFVRIAVTLGINKVRLTGGEPLVRRHLPTLIEKLAAVPGLADLGLTTNGMLLAPVAKTLWEAGLRRINISLDTMDAAKFQQLTRRTGFEQVIEGILAAISRPFCLSCNRIRLTSDGKLRNCLFALEETDIRSLLRGGASDDHIVAAVRDCVASKWEGHEINTSRFIQPERLMHAIGG